MLQRATCPNIILLKSVQGLPLENSIDVPGALFSLLGQIFSQQIPERLQSADTTVQEGAVADLLVILQTFQNAGNTVASLINPDLIDLLLTSMDPVFIANDVIQASAGDFTVQGDPLVFIRPYLLSFEAAAEQS